MDLCWNHLPLSNTPSLKRNSFSWSELANTTLQNPSLQRTLLPTSTWLQTARGLQSRMRNSQALCTSERGFQSGEEWMEEKSNNANISPAKLLGKLKIILKLAITENCRVSLVAQLAKNSPANAGDARDKGLISRSGRSPWEGKDNLLQHSWLENFMDREAWQATVHGVPKS